MPTGLIKNRNFVSKGTALFRPAVQTSVGANAVINAFNTVVYNDSTSIVKTDAANIVLKAGKKYKLMAAVHIYDGATAVSSLDFQFYNVTSAALIGTYCRAMNVTYTSAYSVNPVCMAIVEAAVDTTIQLKTTGADSTSSVGLYSSIIVEEVEAYMQLNPLTAGQEIVQAVEKTTPVDADMVGLMDSAASNILKKLSWANIKATLNATVRTWSAKQTFDGGAAIKGATTAVSAGYVGEEIKATVVRGSAVSCTTTQWRDVTNVSLTAGVWLVSGTICGVGTSTAAIIQGGVGTVTGNDGTGVLDGDAVSYGVYNLGTVDINSSFAARVLIPSTTTTYYLKAYFSGSGTCSAYGTIRAIRIA